VTRVEIQPGAVLERPHHDDVRYSLWVPVSRKTEDHHRLVETPWQPLRALFTEKGTPRGFQNVGDTPAAVLEIFVKDGASAAKIQALGVTPGALAKP